MKVQRWSPMNAHASAIQRQPLPAGTRRPAGMNGPSGNDVGESSTRVRGAAYGFSAIRRLLPRSELAIALGVRHEHANHAVLARRQKQLAVAAAAQVQVGARERRAHRALDELAERGIDALPRCAANIELN